MAEGPQVTERLPVPPSGDSTEIPLPATHCGKKKHLPTCIIVLGMAGSGKTTFVQRLTAELYRGKTSQPYVVNLDPACREVPYPANIDIRDTVNYKQEGLRIRIRMDPH
jgi:GTPase SAR1 family protein